MYFDPLFQYPASATACALLAAFFDVRSRRIPNLLTGPAFLLALSLHTAVEGRAGLLNALAAGVVGGLVFLVFYVLGGMGAGDVKLMAAVCALAGFSNVPYILVLTGLCGGVMGLAIAARHGRIRQTLINVAGLTTHHLHHGLAEHPEMNVRNAAMLRLPYGVAIAAGCTLTLWLRTTGR